MWPLHLQIELTDNCNLYCDYCYRNSKNNIKKANYISFHKIKKSLDNLKSKNLLEIGITGGEPTLHPNFKDIMHYVLKNFELVELVTNAKNKEVLIDMLKTLSSKMESRLNLSISFNKWLRDLPKFKSKKHYLFKTLKEITKIHSVRVICTDYLYNNFKSKEIVKLLKNVGVKSIDFSFVLPIGRGKNKINELEYLKRYPFRKKKSFTPTGYNCGLILKHTAVDPSGNLRPCALFPLSFVIGSLYSNLFKKDFRKLYTLQAPNKEICGDCKNYLYCVGCIYKGLCNTNKYCEYKKYIKGDIPYY